MRLFVGLDLPWSLRERLALLAGGIPGARWLPPDNYHITLRFIGEVAEPVAEDLDAELAAISVEALTLRLEGVGAFGEGEAIHAVWAGVAENPTLRRLAARCESAARRAGLAPDRRTWKPHVTLAYLNRPDPARVAAWIQGHNLLKSPDFRVTSFGLYSSWPGAGGSSYRLEAEYPLG